MSQKVPATESSSASISDDAPKKGSRRVLVNTGAMAGSSLWRILVSFLLQLMVARVLGLESLFQYTVALAWLNVSQILAELGLQNLLVRNLARQTSNRRRYFTMSLSLQFVASLLVWTLLWAASAVLPYSDAMHNILWLVGATLPFYAVTISCQTLFQAAERMELVMIVEIVINTLIGVLSLIILSQQGGVGQLMGLLIGTQALSALLCLYLLYRQRLLFATVPAKGTEAGAADEDVDVGYWQLLRESLPFYGLSLTDVLLQRLDILLISIFASPEITGLYSAAYNVVRILQKLIQSYWKALYPTLSRLAHQASLAGQTLKHQAGYQALQRSTLKYGLLILLGVAVVATYGGGVLLNIIYGPEIDLDAATAAFRVLIWSAPITLVELYAITILMAEDRPRTSLSIMAVHLATVASSLPLMSTAYGTQGAAWAVLLATIVGALVSVAALNRVGSLFEGASAIWLFVPALGTGVILALTPFVNIGVMSGGIVLYLALVWLCGIVTLADLRKLRKAT